MLPDVVKQRYLELVFEDMGFDALFAPTTHSMILQSHLSESFLELSS